MFMLDVWILSVNNWWWSAEGGIRVRSLNMNPSRGRGGDIGMRRGKERRGVKFKYGVSVGII